MTATYQTIAFNQNAIDHDHTPYSTPRSRFFERHYTSNYQTEVKNTLWVKTQPAFKDTTPEEYGHGVYLLLLTPLIKRIRENPKRLPQKADLVLDQLLEDYRNGQLFEVLPISEQNLLVMAEAIDDGIAADLPSASVKVIKAKLTVAQRLKDQGKPIPANVTKHVLKAIKCRADTTVTATKKEDGTEYLLHDTFQCKTKGCTNTMCHMHAYHKRVQTIKRNIKAVADTMTNKQQMVMITLTTEWNDYNHDNPPNLTEHFLKHHLQARKDFLTDKVIKTLLHPNSHVTTEIAFSVPSKPNYRCIPNPHSHIITAIPASIDTFALDQNLNTIWEAHNDTKGFLSIKPITLGEHIDDDDFDDPDDDVEDVSERLAKYLAKGITITPDELNEEQQTNNFMASNAIEPNNTDISEEQVALLFQSPTPANTPLVLDTTSTIEIEELYLLKRLRLNEVINRRYELTTKQQQQIFNLVNKPRLPHELENFIPKLYPSQRKTIPAKERTNYNSVNHMSVAIHKARSFKRKRKDMRKKIEYYVKLIKTMNLPMSLPLNVPRKRFDPAKIPEDIRDIVLAITSPPRPLLGTRKNLFFGFGLDFNGG